MSRYRESGKTKIDSTPALVLGPDADAILDLDVREGSLSELSGATVAVSTSGIGSGKEVGEHIDLILGDGANVRARVVAVYRRGLGFGDVVLSRDLVRGHTTTALDSSILVRLDHERAERELTAIATLWPGVEIHDADVGPLLGGTPPQVWVNLGVLAVLLGYVLVAAANKLAATTTGRRDELTLLRMIGATPRQVRAMIRREAGLIAAVALVTGVALSAVPLALLGVGFLGRPWPAGPAWLLPVTAAVITAIAWIAIVVPARRILR